MGEPSGGEERSGVVGLALVVALAVVAATGPAAVAAQDQGVVVGRPDLELTVADNRVTWGDRTTLDVFVSNSGFLQRGGPAEFEQRVQTARNLRMRVATEELPGPLRRGLTVRTDTVTAGNVPPGSAGPFQFRVEVGDSIPPGTYEVPIEVAYDYSNTVEFSQFDPPEYSDVSRTETLTVPLVVEDRARFDLRAAPGQSVTAGDTASYRLTVTNTGTETATNATLTLRTGNSSLFFGEREVGDQRQTVFLRRLDPGQSRTVEVQVGATPGTRPGTYPVNGVVRYETTDGVARVSKRVDVGVDVAPEQTFRVRRVTDNLLVGGTGTVSGQVVNVGGQPARNAVVVFESDGSVFRPRQTEYAVGSLGAGEAANFSFQVDVVNGTEPGPRQATLRVRYRNPDDEVRTSDPLDARVTVAAEQEFAARNVVGNLRVGATGTLTGTLVNLGERPVSSVVVRLASGTEGLRPTETEYAVGSMDPGEVAPFAFEVSVANGTDPGPRQVRLLVSYRDAADERRTARPLTARVPVAAEQTFAVRDVASTLRVGGRGTVRGVVVNTGDDAATEAVVEYAASNPNLQPRETEYAVGSLGPGEAAPFSFDVGVTNDTEPGPRRLTFRVRYRDAGDDQRTSDALPAVVDVAPEQSFAVVDVADTLRVGRSGEIRGVVRNDGDRPVGNAVVRLASANPTLQPRETEVAVGDLGPGESAPFSFQVDVNGEAEPGPRQVRFRVRYRDEAGDRRVGDPIDAQVGVDREADEFRVEALNATVPAGGSALVRLRVTNVDDQQLSDVEAKLFVDDPLSSDSDEAFVPTLAPNESAEVVFEVSAGGAAVAKTYPLSVDFSYEDERGDDVLSDTYLVPVAVVEEERRETLPSLPGISTQTLVVGGLAVAVVLGLGWWKRGAIRGVFS